MILRVSVVSVQIQMATTITVIMITTMFAIVLHVLLFCSRLGPVLSLVEYRAALTLQLH